MCNAYFCPPSLSQDVDGFGSFEHFISTCVWILDGINKNYINCNQLNTTLTKYVIPRGCTTIASSSRDDYLSAPKNKN